jgi:hypothetical protein
VVQLWWKKETDMNPSLPLWRQAYLAALFEPDKNKRLERMKEAEMAVALRARELFHNENNGERQAVDAAMYALQTLRRFEGPAERSA